MEVKLDEKGCEHLRWGEEKWKGGRINKLLVLIWSEIFGDKVLREWTRKIGHGGKLEAGNLDYVWFAIFGNNKV